MAESLATGWYYATRGASAGQPIGPLAWEEFRARAQASQFGPDDLVWNPAFPEWVPAAQISGLFPTAAAPAVQASYPAARSTDRRRRSRLYWVVPLVVLLLVGAGLGAYFGFLRGGDTDLAASGVTSTTLSASTSTIAAVTTTTVATTTTTVATTTTEAEVTTTTSALPTYSEVVSTYPADATLIQTEADIVGGDDNGLELGNVVDLAMVDGQFVYKSYGTKLTVTATITLEGKTYQPGAKLTVDKNLHWIEVSSWD